MTQHRNKPRSTHKPAAARAQRPANNRAIAAAAIGLGLIVVSAIGLWWLSQNSAQSAAAPVAPTTVAGPVINPSATANASVANPAVLPIKQITQLDQLPPGKAERVEVVYFHRTQRCKSCQEAERLTRKTLDTFFTEQMSSGLISLATIDVQALQNAAQTRKYGASESSLFFGIVKNGVEYLCPINDIWYVLGNEAKFLPLLRDRINTALGEG